MNKLAIVKIDKEITGVFLSPNLIELEDVEVNVVDFGKILAPWEEKVVEEIEQLKLVKIA